MWNSNRAKHFTDPIVGIKKKIFIENDGIISEYEDNLRIEINIINNSINIINNFVNQLEDVTKLKNIHSKLKLKHGSMNDELPEQKMAVRSLRGKKKF